MRDSNAPIINGYDCSGLVNRYSLLCEQSFPECGDTARTLDGASQTDVFPRKIRLSWTLNSVTAQQFADFNAALDTSDTINLVSVVAYDPTRDALCSGNFYVTRPAFPFALAVNGSAISQAGAELILDQQGALDWISVTPPVKLSYEFGDAFDSAGFSVALSDDNGAVTDITSECSLSIADGDLLPDAGNIPVSVTRNGVQIGAFTLSVNAAEVIADGGWWTLYRKRNFAHVLDIHCIGDMPTPQPHYHPWQNYVPYSVVSGQEPNYAIHALVIRNGVTGIGEEAFRGLMIKNVALPDSVKQIGESAFRDCRFLTQITFPDGLVSIGNLAFYNSMRIANVTIPKTTSNMSGAFRYCGLSTVTILDGVESISDVAFADCYFLSEANIPKSVKYIGRNAFIRCPRLHSVTISRDCQFAGYESYQQPFDDSCVISYYEDEEAGT